MIEQIEFSNQIIAIVSIIIAFVIMRFIFLKIDKNEAENELLKEKQIRKDISENAIDFFIEMKRLEMENENLKLCRDNQMRYIEELTKKE